MHLERFDISQFSRLFCVPIVAIVCLLLAMAYEKSRDPFRRIEFSLNTPGARTKAIAVVPNLDARFPIVIYVHGSGDGLMTDGKPLRQFAELGLATVAMEYNQTNETSFAEQFEALRNFVQCQTWAQSNSVAWVGVGLGARRTLQFLLNHPRMQPQVVVQLSGCRDAELQDKFLFLDSRSQIENEEGIQHSKNATTLRCSFLLVHCEEDTIFPIEDTKCFTELLESNRIPVSLRIFHGVSHHFGLDWPLVLRETAEYCRAHLPLTDYNVTGVQLKKSANELQQSRRTYWRYWMPLVLIVGNIVLLWRWRKSVRKNVPPSDHRELSPACTDVPIGGSADRSNAILKVMAVLSAFAACAVTGFHLTLPRVPANDGMVEFARARLVEPRLRSDFNYLVQHSHGNGKSLEPLLTHLELADLQRHQFYLDLPEPTFQQYILSPEIGSLPLNEVNWRRTLWENFYPRIRHESNPVDAAQIVLRFLRERVGINPACHYRIGIESTWTEQMTDEIGFQRIYVAALRSVGVAARLDDKGNAEFLAGDQWRAAPRLEMDSFEDKNF